MVVLAGNRSKGDTDAPDVELIVNDGPTMAFVALYESEARAKRYEPGIRRRAEEFGGSVERQGAISILWVQEPSSDLRGRVEGCVFG